MLGVHESLYPSRNPFWQAPSSRPPRFDTKFPLGTAPGDMTPKHDPRASFDSGRPSTSNSASGYPAPIGPPR
jgi:hypothetical protein